MGYKNRAKGGMQSCASQYSIICPKCNKPAFSAELGEIKIYKHFTKNGAVAHILDENGQWKTKKLSRI